MNGTMNRMTLYAASALLTLLLPGSQAAAYSTGPPDLATGAPGESTCGIAGCHGNLNVGSGSVAIDAPVEYKPGDTVDIAVMLQMLGQSRWGFEATVLDSDDQPVGEILVADSERTQLSNAFNGRQYIKHRQQGTDAGVFDEAPGWTFRWVAPAAGSGPVTFYVAGNAANNDLLSSGDYPYTSNSTIFEASATDAPDGDRSVLPARPHLAQNYPNPFNPETRISYTLPRSASVTLVIYNAVGRVVRTLVSGRQSPGQHAAEWDGLDDFGHPVASGVYLYRLTTDDGFVRARKMMLIR